ncbi:MAG: hypothetical protein P8Y18_09700 [Candidatus Bathyarchaeota archaeon]
MASKESIITTAMIVLVIYTVTLSFVSQTFSASQVTRTVPNSGSIQIETSPGIGLYLDCNCSLPEKSLEWGRIEPGNYQSISLYIKNESPEGMIFSIKTSKWEPAIALDYINLNWDYNGQEVKSGEVIQILLTLAVDSDIEGVTDFNFDILIAGVQ